MKYSRAFQGIPVREARASLHVQPNKDDIKGATKEDPTNCAYARCLRRTLECTVVYVFKSIAYIQTLDERGKASLERYVVRHYAREYLLKFDGGERVEPGGFVFHAPARSRTLDYKVKDYARRKHRSPHTAIRGKVTSPTTYELRSGKGQVHFSGPGTITKYQQK